jgi:hypothetical protein
MSGSLHTEVFSLQYNNQTVILQGNMPNFIFPYLHFNWIRSTFDLTDLFVFHIAVISPCYFHTVPPTRGKKISDGLNFPLNLPIIWPSAGAGEGGAVAAGADDLTGKGKQSRGEKKARKIMSKLGLKQVSFVQNQDILFVILIRLMILKKKFHQMVQEVHTYYPP